MSKVKESRIIITRWTRNKIISHAAGARLVKDAKWTTPLLLVILAVVMYCAFINDDFEWYGIAIGGIGLILLYIYDMVVCRNYGKKYWEYIKDKEEPIEIKSIKEWWK